MRRFKDKTDFYNSDEWRDFRKVVIAQRLTEDGYTIDEYTGKPIVRAYDIILHHKEELTEENLNDVNVSLNPDNIMIVSHKSHNLIHDNFNTANYRQVFIVYGAPLSGKSTWVKDNAGFGDLIVDMDNIWECVSGCRKYVKPKLLNAVAFRVRDTLLDCVKYRIGKWRNAYLVGGYPFKSERERMLKEFGAREVHIESTKEECLDRLSKVKDARSDEWEKFICDWFEKFSAT